MNLKTMPLLIITFAILFLPMSATLSGKQIARPYLYNDMLQKSREAATAGNYKKAEQIWQRARVYQPDQEKPVWLIKKQALQRDNSFKAETNKDALLKKVDGLDYTQARQLLDSYLKKFPGETEVRQKSLELAILNNDSFSQKRHESFLGVSPKNDTISKYFKVIPLIIIFLIIIYQIRLLLKDMAQK